MTGSDHRRILLNTLHLIFIFAIALTVQFPVIKSQIILPTHDNIDRHFTNYLYFADSLRFGFGFPLWYPYNGGLPIGVTSAFMFPLTPHRLIGYLFYVLLPLSPLIMYKVNLMSGLLLISFGWWLFLYKFVRSRLSATFGCLMIILGGTGITIFHQEQILATMTWIPWLLLALLKLREDIRFLIVLSILTGYSINMHCPHIQILLLLFIFLALFFTGKVTRFFYRIKLSRLPLLGFAALIFILAASPALYVYKTKKDFSSPHRDLEEVKAGSLEEYLRLNRQQISSAPFAYLANYIKPRVDVIDDQFIFFVTTLGLFFGAWGAIFRFRCAVPVIIVLFLSLWAVLGINAYLPQLLYLARFPLIGYFRQWYHFVPILNFCLSVLGALGFSVLLSFIMRRLNSTKIVVKNIIVFIFVGALFATMFYEGRRYFTSYAQRHLRHISYKQIELMDERGFLSLLKEDWFSGKWTEHNFGITLPGKVLPLVVYSEWFKFSWNNSRDFNLVCLTAPLPLDSSNLQMIDFNKLNYYRLEKDYWVVTPRGVILRELNAEINTVVVFPFVYKLGLAAYLNRQRTKTYPVCEGAMTGVGVPKGRSELRIFVPWSGYQFALLLQAILLIYALYLSRKININQNPEK